MFASYRGEHSDPGEGGSSAVKAMKQHSVQRG